MTDHATNVLYPKIKRAMGLRRGAGSLRVAGVACQYLPGCVGKSLPQQTWRRDNGASNLPPFFDLGALFMRVFDPGSGHHHTVQHCANAAQTQ